MQLAECFCMERECKHFIGVGEEEPIKLPDDYEGIVMDFQCYICKAFPKYPGIPPVICDGFDLHEKPWKATSDYF